jgi:putative endonuclease
MDRLHRYYVYFVSNKNRTTFYVGVTNNLSRRATEHNEGHGSDFTAKYKATTWFTTKALSR